MVNSYAEEEYDEFVKPSIIMKDGRPIGRIEKGDSVICFNFRPDRAREITRTLVDPDFNGFERDLPGIKFVCLTQYDKTMPCVSVAFKPSTLENTLGEYLAKLSVTQFRIAETEKYAHVTFFFNGGVEKPNDGEDRYLIPSPKDATYDMQPEMSAYEVADKACELIKGEEYQVMILNFANPDMVGHTGVLDAAIAAVHAVDECVGKVVRAIEEIGGKVLITADHGNADEMVAQDGKSPFTAHTTNPVPLILVDPKRKDASLREDGILADIAPTLLDLMEIEIPAEMTGSTLIKK